MRLLFVSDLWPPFPGGAEFYIKNVADALAERGHEIHILTSYAKAKSRHPLTIENIGVGERHAEGETILDRFLTEPFDAVISHHYFVGEFSNWFSDLPVPFIEIVHNRQRHPDAAFAIFNSQYTADRCGFRDGDMVMLPPVGEYVVDHDMTGILPNHFHAEYIGHIKPIPNRYWRGRLYGKGIDLTYRLARLMPERKFLVLRGEWQDVEMIEQLPNVEFMEPVEDIRDFYARCRIVLMPSGSEDAGTVPMECAVNGIPCISSNVDGLKETNLGGHRLLLDIEEWISVITDLDKPEFYANTVASQKSCLPDWEPQFDEIDQKMRALCA